MNLYQKIKSDVVNWRQQDYPSSCSVIATILNFNKNSFLRQAQFEALETYWYLRLVKNTPNIFEKSEGAVIFRGEKYGLHTRVFVNSEGLPIYEAKELGLAKIKHDKFKYDTSVVVTGNEINDYFNVLLKAMELIYPDLAKITKHIGHGMLRFASGKMSSRKGNVITGEELIERVKKMVLDKTKEREFSEKEREDSKADGL